MRRASVGSERRPRILDLADYVAANRALAERWAAALPAQVRRPVYASSVGKWRVHEERLAPFRLRMQAAMSAQLRN